MKFTKYIVILTLFTLISCVTNRLIFHEKQASEFDKLDIQTVVKLERQKHSKDITPERLIGIGEGIYPNINKYVLATPKTYVINETPNFRLETQYFYVATNSMVKVILYQWDYLEKEKSDFIAEKKYTKKFKVFQAKFDELVTQLTSEFGEPVSTNIKQSKVKDETFRDDLRFKRADEMNAYLFMFGNDNSGFRQIRLAVYKD
ncbi:hypothetical protein [Sphingobacterium bambusae]|uniref:Lipoprotein n=1 Tax=Sphingobacterium bambusae TaxID=662858 RepID=A0ABW6BJN2_9SPHI|nr:hypothetical protein [Sphingobacterium bambusae]WPL49311.1 hypothetical protein SCB77_02430 [Sphingobacterium bambusae]